MRRSVINQINKIEILKRTTHFQTIRHLSKYSNGDVNSYQSGRTHHCGELRVCHEGEKVKLCGWLHKFKMNQFVLLKDSHGITQVVLPGPHILKAALSESSSRAAGAASKLIYAENHTRDVENLHEENPDALNTDSIIEVEGIVKIRNENHINKKLDTGEIEIEAEQIKILNSTQNNMPFENIEFQRVGEQLRLTHRFLDLRHDKMQQNLRLRSQVINKMREFLCSKCGFVDVETPTLHRRTPGGAQEFVVPTQIAGHFYALTQSPQVFKQMLMVGGIDRYMQVARCYRDEGGTPERQPEFTQLDLEMSFVKQEDIKCLIEDLMVHCWPDHLPPISTPFPRMTYAEAMQDYATDKPDLRHDWKVQEITNLVKDSTESNELSEIANKPGMTVKAINIKNGGFWNKEAILKEEDVQKFQQKLKEVAPDTVLHLVRIKAKKKWHSSLPQSLGIEVLEKINAQLGLENKDQLIITAGPQTQATKLIGSLRVMMAQVMEEKGVPFEKNAFKFVWVEDFPMFLPAEDGSEGLESAHHPFTAPHEDDDHILFEDPLRVRSQHYDLVLNGSEIGGGSIRIHNSLMQKYVIEKILKESTASLEYLLRALNMGCPPHGGIALGLDRLISIMCGASSIRDVIAFPKDRTGRDRMCSSPATLSDKDKDTYHILTSETQSPRDEKHSNQTSQPQQLNIRT